MGVVYLLGDWEKDGLYKIGFTRGDVHKRIKKLQTGNGGEIYLVKQYESDLPTVMEKMLHDKFFNQRVKNEWFELSDEDVKNFEKTCNVIADIIESLKDNYFFKKKYKLE